VSHLLSEKNKIVVLLLRCEFLAWQTKENFF